MGEGNVGESSPRHPRSMGNALKFGYSSELTCDLEVKTDDNGKVSVGLNLKVYA